MARVKRGVASKKRHKKTLKQAKGYYGTRRRLIKTAREAVERGWKYSYRDRKQRKRQFRVLWIARINAAVREKLRARLAELEVAEADLGEELQGPADRPHRREELLRLVDGHLRARRGGDPATVAHDKL